MSFISISFIIFLLILFPTYFYLSDKYRWIFLLIASYIFYSFANPKFLIFLLITTISTYLAGLLIHNHNNKKIYKNLCLMFALLLNIGILSFFKYYKSFFPNSISLFFPLGISFYTFQALSYTIDIYRKDIKPEKNIAKYALFISFFPQFIMGPISRFKDLSYQFYKKFYFDKEIFISGILRILYGVFKKLVISDRIGIFINLVFSNYNDYPGFVLFLSTLLYIFQVYTDFSGYMDIAIGTSNCIGINIKENFNSPFFSKTLKELWTKWHITLYSWFKDYVYIPLGGNKVSKIRLLFNILFVWFLVGLWHGSSLNFILFGVANGFFICLEILLQKYDFKNIKFKQNYFYKLFQMLRTFIIFSFIALFTIPILSCSDIFAIIKKIITNFLCIDKNMGLVSNFFSIYQWYVIIIGILIILLIDFLKFKNKLNIVKINIMTKLFIIYILTVIIVSCGKFGNTTFIYFNF